MRNIDLRYGRDSIHFEFDEERFEVLGADPEPPGLTDAEIGSRLESPVDSLPPEDLVRPGETVLIVIPDATRQAGAGQIVNLLVRRLIAGGTSAHLINAIFATGIHRAVTAGEKQQILTPFVAQRILAYDHDAHDRVRNFLVGEISPGIPIELNWRLTEFDHVFLVGGVTFHYFAGFTGGRKLVCPGLASARTISETHKLAFDFEKRVRVGGVGSGRLDGNPVHGAFTEAAALVDPSFAINTIVNDNGEVVDLHCGNWRTSHRAACNAFASAHTVDIREKRDIVISSCGGYPFDINMIQAHKTVEAASHACREGGTIILLAQCPDGLGRDDFIDWFDLVNSEALSEKLCSDYKVNGQTALSMLRMAERFEVNVLTTIAPETVRKMRLVPIHSLDDAVSALSSEKGFILPYGARIRVTI